MRPKFVWQPDLRDGEPVSTPEPSVPESLEQAALYAARGDGEPPPRAPRPKPPRPEQLAPPPPLVEEAELDDLFAEMEKPAPAPLPELAADTLAPEIALTEPPVRSQRAERRSSWLLTVMVAVGVLAGSVLAVTPLRAPPRLLARGVSPLHLALDMGRVSPRPSPVSEPSVEHVLDLDDPAKPQALRTEPETKPQRAKRGPPRVIVEYAPFRSVPIRPGEQIGVFPPTP